MANRSVPTIASAAVLGLSLNASAFGFGQVDEDLLVGEELNKQGQVVHLVHDCGFMDCGLEELTDDEFADEYGEKGIRTVDDRIADYNDRQQQMGEYAEDIIKRINSPGITQIYNDTVKNEGLQSAVNQVGIALERGYSPSQREELGLTESWNKLRELAVENRMDEFRLNDLAEELKEEGKSWTFKGFTPGL
ncbi:MAG: hypothetical protein H6868_06065 [Rhodospirillales bacterium]|nr:hypothetical protein [Rhodospirillales bacterium]